MIVLYENSENNGLEEKDQYFIYTFLKLYKLQL